MHQRLNAESHSGILAEGRKAAMGKIVAKVLAERLTAAEPAWQVPISANSVLIKAAA